MSKIWSPQPIEVYKSWVESIITEASDNLNEWETDFIESIGIRIYNDNQLTEAQAKALEKIYVKHTL